MSRAFMLEPFLASVLVLLVLDEIDDISYE